MFKLGRGLPLNIGAGDLCLSDDGETIQVWFMSQRRSSRSRGCCSVMADLLCIKRLNTSEINRPLTETMKGANAHVFELFLSSD